MSRDFNRHECVESQRVEYLFEFVEIIWLFVKVQLQQFTLEIFTKGFAAEEILDDAVWERVTIQLHITYTEKRKRKCKYVRLALNFFLGHKDPREG